MRTTALLLIPFLLLACGGRSETLSPDGGWTITGDGEDTQNSGGSDGGALGGGSHDGGATSTGGGFVGTGGTMLEPTGGATSTRGAGLSEAETFCTETCEAVVPQVESGCAGAMVCGEAGECLARADRWNTVAREAFEYCLEFDHLCFITAEGCMLDYLFEEVPYEVLVHGRDFDFPEGTIVGLSATQRSQIGQLSGGSFSLSGRSDGSADHPHPVLVWIDVSQDGACGEGDLTAFVSPMFNGDFSEPLFIEELEFEQFVENPSLCSSFP